MLHCVLICLWHVYVQYMCIVHVHVYNIIHVHYIICRCHNLLRCQLAVSMMMIVVANIEYDHQFYSYVKKHTSFICTVGSANDLCSLPKQFEMHTAVQTIDESCFSAYQAYELTFLLYGMQYNSYSVLKTTSSGSAG